LIPPIDAKRIDERVVISGPGDFNASLTPKAARALANLQRALEGSGEAQETYQKPLG
jgi:hypothetical protein